MGKVFGTIALICGVLGFVGLTIAHLFPLFFFGFGWFLLPGAAIIFGLIGAYVDDPKGVAWGGIIIGFFGLLTLPIFYMVLGLALYD